MNKSNYNKDNKLCDYGMSAFYLQSDGWVTSCSNSYDTHSQVYQTPLSKGYKQFMIIQLIKAFDEHSLWL